MRSALRFALGLGLALPVPALASGCHSTECHVAPLRAQPTTPGDVHFVATLSRGAAAEIVLLTTTEIADFDAGVHDAGLHDPERPTHAATSVAVVRDYTTPTGASTDEVWLDQRSEWQLLDSEMHEVGDLGRGIGSAPVVPPAAPGGPFVAIGGASSIVRFALGAQDDTDAGTATNDTGPPRGQRMLTWEWLLPRNTTGPDGGAPPPMDSGAATIDLGLDAGPSSMAPPLADLLVVPRESPDHDLAFVARTPVTDALGQRTGGGELFVLDIEDPTNVVLLRTMWFGMYADMGLQAYPSQFAFSSGHAGSPRYGVIYVALDHQNYLYPTPMVGPGLVAVIDADTQRVITVLRAPTVSHCTGIAPYVPPTPVVTDTADPDSTEPFRFVVTCTGAPPATSGSAPSDGGFLFVDEDPHNAETPSISHTILSTAYGFPRADGGSTPLVGPWVAYVSRGTLSPLVQDRAFAVNLLTGDMRLLLSVAPENNGTPGLGPPAFDPSSGVVVVPRGYDGVSTWQMPRARTRIGSEHVRPTGTDVWTFPDDPNTVAVAGCAHLPVRTVRLVGGGAAPIMPMGDAGMPVDAGVIDTGTPIDTGAIDAGMIDSGSQDSGMDSGG